MVALKYGAREVTLKQGTGSPVVPLALVGMLSACGLMLSRIYAGPLLLRLMVGAAVLVVAISLAMRRLPAWSTAPVSVAGLAGYTLLSVRLSAAASDLPGTIGELTRDAAYNGIPRLLTAMIPIEPQPDTVVIPVVSVWIAGLASAELALRGRRVLLSYLPIALLLAGCLYVVGPNATPAPVPAMIFAACAAFGLAGSVDGDRAVRQDLPGADRRAIRLRVAAGAATGLVAVLAAGMALGPVAAGLVSHSPTDPRRYVAPPHLDSLDESPLARLSGWALEPSQHLFDVTAPGGPHRIRLAVLSDFDGVTWRVGGNYQTAGRILSGPPSQVDPGAAAGESVEQSIVIDQLDGRLVPAITTPERIEGVRIAYDPEIATMALPEGLRPGLAYTVVSRKPVVNAEVLAAATTPQDEETVRRLTKLQGDVPPDIERLASQLAEGADSPYQRALAIEQFIAEHYQQVADAPSGHAYPNLSFFLFTARNAGGQKGTSEQFAASFAVLGRALGLATRVAVGFDVPDGQTSVTAANALAWPEVLFEGMGWVAFNPLPRPDTKPKPVENDFRPTPEPTPPSPSSMPTPSTSTMSPAGPATAAGPPPAGTGGGWPWHAITATVAAVLLPLAYLLIPWRIRARRRRRLWQGDPASRVLGAWYEINDLLRLAGRPAPPSLAATEVSAFAARATAGPSHGLRPAAAPTAPEFLTDLAALVNRVVFAPIGVTADEAGRAVALAVGYRTELLSRRSRRQRWLWALDPRPLLWERQIRLDRAAR